MTESQMASSEGNEMQFWILVAAALLVSAVLGIALFTWARQRLRAWKVERERLRREEARQRAKTESWKRIAREIERAA